MVAVIQVELFGGDFRQADRQAYCIRIQLPVPPLAATRAESCNIYAQGLTRPATAAPRPKNHVPEPPPALPHPLEVLDRRHFCDEFVIEPRLSIRQVRTRRRRRIKS